MSEFLHFSLLGLGVGALYALSGLGLVVIYRGSGVLNFAQGAMAVAGGLVYYQAQADGLPYALAVLIAIAATALIAALFHLLVLRGLRNSSAIMRMVATLALLICLQGIATIKYGGNLLYPPTELPQTIVRFGGGVTVSLDRLLLLAAVALATAAMWAVFRFTRFGIATSAVAENQVAAAATGLRPDRVATLNWAFGSAMAAVTGILIAPILGLSVLLMTTMVLASLAAALVGGFRSFPLTLLGALFIGVLQTVLPIYTSQTGLPSTAPFLVIVAVLVVRGRSLPLRGFLLDRLPAVGTGRIRWGALLLGTAVFLVLALTLSPTWTDSFSITFATAIVLLSIVVLTGYAGQLSLGQWALAGMGAYVAGRLVAIQHWPFEVAFLAGIAGAALVGVVFAVPAVRTRGVNLAIVTLGLGAAIDAMVFNNEGWTGGFSGTTVGNPTLFGLNINATVYSNRYSIVCFAPFLLSVLAVANLRRGRVGRRLLAIRVNERAAAALGVRVAGVKLYAFGLAAALAGVGGILTAFRSPVITYPDFDSTYSIALVGFAVIGSIGWLGGSLLGATLASGAVGAQLLAEVWPSSQQYVSLIAGVLLILMISTNPEGLAFELAPEGRGRGGFVGDLLHPSRALARQLPRAKRGIVRAVPALRPLLLRGDIPTAQRLGLTAPPADHRAEPKLLTVEHLSVRYGAVTAVDDVSLEVAPGEIVGLIGPNGAGKTTFIDAVSGFTPGSRGTVRLGGQDITRWGVSRRARAGLSRSFQALELFDDMTVLDNLRVGFEPQDIWSYLLDLLHPRRAAVPGQVAATVHDFELLNLLDERVDKLPYGARRLVGVARAISTSPSVLMLDEPAAGLSEAETAEFANLVRHLAGRRGLGVLLVEHDVNFVMTVCDRVVVLDFGRCISQGTPAEVRTDPAVLAAYLGDEDSYLGDDDGQLAVSAVEAEDLPA
ncbi:MAG TPA: branched-chain amino acid ABC transporter permease/ATP-binding protein [Trebonia sp.]|nr:branched-chain amino acid ABC transporter permease/ATP-binding protein [Trebonia sp.]